MIFFLSKKRPTVPETVLKKRKRLEQIKASRAKSLLAQKKVLNFLVTLGSVAEQSELPILGILSQGKHSEGNLVPRPFPSLPPHPPRESGEKALGTLHEPCVFCQKHGFLGYFAAHIGIFKKFHHATLWAINISFWFCVFYYSITRKNAK